MSHYGYVSEQLLTGEIFPPRRRGRSRRGWRPRRRTTEVSIGFDVERLRSRLAFPGTGRVVTGNAATTETARGR